jgi:hypothetical protein
MGALTGVRIGAHLFGAIDAEAQVAFISLYETIFSERRRIK